MERVRHPVSRPDGLEQHRGRAPLHRHHRHLFLGTFIGGRIQDRIGPRPVALTGVAWSIGGVVGPLAIAAIHDAVDSFALPFYLIAAMCLLSMALPLTTRKPAEREVALEQQPTEA